ncbi:MAG: carbamoyltransferase [Magnetococcales bacterium]|nr:carbamoyltransferase [Magnetococcales bacterium]
MAIILGLNAYHADSAAALVVDGQLVAAAEEERFRRIKHWAGFPTEAIRSCLSSGGITLDQVDVVAINSNPKANLWRKMDHVLRYSPDPGFVLGRLRHARRRHVIADELRRHFPQSRFDGEVQRVEHHLAHLASSFLVSSFSSAAALSLDGFGDYASATWGVGQAEKITVMGRICFPHSLGIFYQAMTQYLGFPHFGDEYKVMGLAPYGEPTHMEAMGRIVRMAANGDYSLDLDFFRHHRENIHYEWDNGVPSVGDLFTPSLEKFLGPRRQPDEELTQRHKDIARSVQAMYEAAFFHLLNALYRQTGLDNLALAGGCAMNSVANGRIGQHTPFRNVYIQAAAGDAGGAIGAAMVVWCGRFGGSRPGPMDHAYLGPAYADTDYERLLSTHAANLELSGCTSTLLEESELVTRTAQAIADGKVVGWFQGRMEWGPRALGNRSILCDPRRADMKEILNRKIKRRESFRPFAPAILRDEVPAWFETDDDVPFMMKVFQIRAEKRQQIPAVTHVDGSGRLQTVTAATNPLYHRLIATFQELTGIPIVLNTSFNENEPVVCQPGEALDCFLRTQMDLLVMGRWFITRTTDKRGV